MTSKIEKNHELNELLEMARDQFENKNFDKMTSTAEEIEKLAKLTTNEEGFYYAASLRARILEAKNLLNLALKGFMNSLQHAQKLNQSELMSEALNNVGRCHGKMENLGMSIEYFKQSLLNDPVNVKALNNLGVAHMRLNNNEEAIEYFLKSYPLCYKEGFTLSAGINLVNISALYTRTNQLDKAEEYLQKAEEIAAELDNPNLNCSILNHRGNLLCLQKDYKKSEKILNMALEKSKQIENKNIELNCCDDLVKLYFEQKNFKQAYYFQNILIELKEKMHKQRLESKVSELHSQFEIGVKEQTKIKDNLEKEKLEAEKRFVHLQRVYSNILEIGSLGIFSETMRKIIQTADTIHLDRNIPTLIEGETGTGKEIIARIIHYGKEKNPAPFIAVNCSAISPSLFESELFGYEKGSFSGAKRSGQAGKLELAQGGSIFFDEIGELPMEMQSKLLRAIQQKEIYRIGGQKPISLDIRFIFATNRKLAEEIKQGKFRLDLFHRLNAGYILIPPLRERKDEIQPLAQMFLQQFAKNKNSKFQFINSEAGIILEQYTWPGNVRELRNAIERIVLLYNETQILPKHLSFLSDAFSDDINDKISGKITLDLPKDGVKLDDLLDEIIIRTYQHFGGNVTKTAKLLNISRAKVYRKIRQEDSDNS
jgi:two-component system, NtrC family, response regulator AtoC